MRSPCRGCKNEFEEKNKCMPSCERINKFQDIIHQNGNSHKQSGFLLPQDVAENPAGHYTGSIPN